MAAKPTSTLVLSTKIQVAIFNEMLLSQITDPAGHWARANPKGHHEVFADMKVKVAGDGEQTGVFDAEGKPLGLRKNNYNFNDSNWVNIPEVTEKLMAIAKKANGGKEMSKKDIVSNLLHIKDIMKTAPKAMAPVIAKTAAVAAVVAAGTGTPAPEEQPKSEELTIEQMAAAAAAAEAGGKKVDDKAA